MDAADSYRVTHIGQKLSDVLFLIEATDEAIDFDVLTIERGEEFVTRSLDLDGAPRSAVPENRRDQEIPCLGQATERSRASDGVGETGEKPIVIDKDCGFSRVCTRSVTVVSVRS